MEKCFENPKKLGKILTFEDFKGFRDTTEASEFALALNQGEPTKGLRKVLKKLMKDGNQTLAVADQGLAANLKQKLGISCVSSGAVQELMSCIRSKIDTLIPEWDPENNTAMQLGLSHE